MKFTCGGYIFNSDFDSGNLGKVQLVRAPIAEENKGNAPRDGDTQPRGSDAPPPDAIVAEFNLWTCPDCGGTQFENSNRTWFFFCVRGGRALDVAKFNVMNLNRQAKLYSQGMHPVVKVGANGKWERIRDKPSYTVEDDNFIVSFLHRGGEDGDQEFFYAFTYPYTYTELQNYLTRLDRRFRKRQFELKVKQIEGVASSSRAEEVAAERLKELENTDVNPLQLNEEEFKSEIYFYRELLTMSVEKRRVDLITISSYHGISDEREQRIENLFPEKIRHRCHTFPGKKIIFVSSRVHPGETPASFVLNGFLNLLLDRKSSIAATLRRLYVFKIVPFLNPDGVYNGLYRSDTLGHNLNRVYLNPNPDTHPPIYAVRKLIRFYHYGCDRAEGEGTESTFGECCEKNSSTSNSDNVTSNEPSPEASEREGDTIQNDANNVENVVVKPDVIGDTKQPPIQEKSPPPSAKVNRPKKPFQLAPINPNKLPPRKTTTTGSAGRKDMKATRGASKDFSGDTEEKTTDSSNMFLYIDLHGHASKKGVFMYGNHMSNSVEAIECMLLPRLMSMNCHHFHFDACNFSERNMYHKGKRDGLSKEGSGRVSVFKMTGLIKSYTLECNYNTGKCVNILPPRNKESASKVVNLLPPKYNPAIFEEIGRALGPSILDLTNSNPLSRLPNSDYRSLQGLRNAMRLELDKTFAKSSHSTTSSGSSGKANTRKAKVIKRSGTMNPPPPLEISKENKAYCNLQNWETRTSVNLVMSRGGSARVTNLLKGQRKGVFGGASKVNAGASTSTPAPSFGKKVTMVKGIPKETHPPPKRKKVAKCDKEQSFDGAKSLTGASSLPNFFPATQQGEPIYLLDVKATAPTKGDTKDDDAKPSCSHEKSPPFLQKLKKTHTFTVLPSTSTATNAPTPKGGKRLQKSATATPLKMKRSLKTEPNIKRKKCRVKTVWH